ncbi:patatin-like phospholipase family protein [Dongia sp. agr-C8]
MNPALPPPPSVGEAFLNEPADSYERNPDSLVYNYLAVSGGGSDGAFGAGLLNGWTRSGTRPKFKFVTGVSTGALIAPFAFLGPDYDETLQQAYTTVDAQRLYLARSLVSLLWEESLNDNKPFRDMIAKYVDEKVLGRIAEEHRKGRRLYVLTTDLDREEPVVWDMGAIAASNSPARLDLFRKVILASASIPAFFPPVLINVKIDDVQKDELHVDGGVFAQSFFVGNQIDLRALERRAHPEWQGKITHRLYVIRNGRLDPQPRKVDRSLGSITAYSIDSMLKASGINDLYRLYLGDLAGELELRYVAIPHDYVPSSLDEFNQAEMIRQYNLGLAMGEKGIPWQRTPPGWQK